MGVRRSSQVGVGGGGRVGEGVAAYVVAGKFENPQTSPPGAIPFWDMLQGGKCISLAVPYCLRKSKPS